MNDEKHIRTIRWDGTCRKCSVKTYFIPVAKKGACVEAFICMLCYQKEMKNDRG